MPQELLHESSECNVFLSGLEVYGALKKFLFVFNEERDQQVKHFCV